MTATEPRTFAKRVPQPLARPLTDTLELQGRVVKVRHFAADSGFTILTIAPEYGSLPVVPGLVAGAPVVLTGRSGGAVEGDDVRATGRFEKDSRYGIQFKAKFIESHVPGTPEGIARWLRAGKVAGLSRAMTERVIITFGDLLPKVISLPMTLIAASIPEEKAKAIASAWNLRSMGGRMMAMLAAHGVGPVLVSRLIEQYGGPDTASRTFFSDPYRIGREVKGLGWKTMDRLARAQGLADDAPARIAAAVRQHLDDGQRMNGQCAAVRHVLMDEVRARLETVPAKPIQAEIEAMLARGDLALEPLGGRDCLYLPNMRDCELEVATHLRSVLASTPIPASKKGVAKIAKGLGVALHEHQSDGVLAALRHGLSVLTGGPGTGKTQTVQVLLACLKAHDENLRIGLAAPTGRAAQRLSESTGHPASTIHRLLAFSPQESGFTKNAENPLELDVLILDETSMLDVWLARDLLRALPPGCRLVLVGDVDQLPPVGPGRVLNDIILSTCCPTTRLTKVFRQGAGSRIALCAAGINAGVAPAPQEPEAGNDMWVRHATDAEIPGLIRWLVETTLMAHGFDPHVDLQVLTPGHQGETGTKALNAVMQGLLNPSRPGILELPHRERILRVGDRVIQTTNNYDREVFNGDIGAVVGIVVPKTGGGKKKRRGAEEDSEEPEKAIVQVAFDGRLVEYPEDDLDELLHAWAITVHKSQGSEFPVVVSLLPTQPAVMLNRPLLYTSVSRARRLCVLLGEKRSMARAVTTDQAGRVTGLAHRLRHPIIA